MSREGATDAARWERDKKILNLKAMGFSLAEIAEKLKVNRGTVSKALENVYKQYTDLMILDGANALTEVLVQTDQILQLALGAFSAASKVVMVTTDVDSGERIEVKQPDWYAKAQFLGKALEAIRLKATALGLTRPDISPIMNFINAQNAQVNQTVVGEIKTEDIPAIRRHLRGARRLIAAKAAAKQDVRRAHEMAGVKQAPDLKELPGVILGDKPAEPSNDGDDDASDTGHGGVSAF